MIAASALLSFPPRSVDRPFHNIGDGVRASAILRNAWQAMIATPVRKTNRLIALFTLARAPAPVTDSRGFLFTGLNDNDHLRFDYGAGRRRASAGKIPQQCGNSSSLMFDVEGLISWLRSRFPRSTAYHVEAETRIPAASIENWLHRRSVPSVQHFAILVSVFGPTLLAAALASPPAWLDDAAKLERRREIDAQIARLERERMSMGGAA